MKKTLNLLIALLPFGSVMPIFINNQYHFFAINHAKNMLHGKMFKQINSNNKISFDQFVQNPSISSDVKADVVTQIGSKIYVGTNNGLWVSSNGGKTFVQNPSIGGKMGVNVITQIGSNIYVGSYSSGLWESSDGGQTFEQNLWIEIGGVYVITQIFGKIYVGTEARGLFVSSDGGTKFVPSLSIPNSSVNVITQIFGKIYVGTYLSGLWISNDEGKTFVHNPSMASPVLGINTVTEVFGKIYVGTYLNGLFVSTNGGKTFVHNPWISGGNVYAITQIGSKIYAGTDGGLYVSSDAGQTFVRNKSLPGRIKITTITENGNIYYLGTYDGLWVSNDGGQTFVQNKSLPSSPQTSSFITTKIGSKVYVGTVKNGLWTKEIFNYAKLMTIRQPDYIKNDAYGLDYLYKESETVSISDELVASATLDGQRVAVPTFDLKITTGQHHLVLTLKNKANAILWMGGDASGNVTIPIWVKTAVDQSLIEYNVNSDTDLETGLTSNFGNTNGDPIIQTKSKISSKSPTASLLFQDQSQVIDYQKSFYQLGTIDTSTNNFKPTGQKAPLSKKTWINNDEIYLLTLTDVVGNQYHAVLELGKANWKTQGTFNDPKLKAKEKSLNVTDSLVTIADKTLLSGWLDRYQNYVSNQVSLILQAEITAAGKGFDYSSVQSAYSGSQLLTKERMYLTPSKWTEARQPDYTKLLNVTKLKHDIDTQIEGVTKQDINQGLAKVSSIAVELKITGQDNVVDKKSLDSYVNWVNQYKIYLNNNSTNLVNQDISQFDLGYLSPNEKQNVLNYFVKNQIINPNYLKDVQWNTSLQPNDSVFKSEINLTELKNAIQNYIQKNYDPQSKLNLAIAKAEQGVDLHGRTVASILEYKKASLPKNKLQIDNFDGKGTSFHNWLQQASNDYNNTFKNTNQKSNSVKIILGSVFGGLAFVLLILIGLCWWTFRLSMKGWIKHHKKHTK